MFRNRQLRAVVVARFVSLTGTNMTTVALPWFVLATTGSTVRMGVVLAVQLLPAAILGTFSGTAVAAVGSRRTLIGSDALRAPLLAAVPGLHWLGLLSFPVLLGLVAAIGLFAVPYAAAANSMLPEIVGEDERAVAQAVAALQVAIQSTGVIGPVLAGVLIPFLGSPSVLLFDGASYLCCAAIVAAFVHAGGVQPRAERARGLFVGVRALFGDSFLTAIVLAAFLAHLGMVGLLSSLPALAFRMFDDARTAGALFAADAAGSILGGLAAVWLTRRVSPVRPSLAGFAVMAAPLWLLSVATPFPLALVVLFVFGVGGPLAVAPISAALTMRVSAAVRPHVVAGFVAISSLGAPIGAAGAGVAIERVGFRATYAAVAALMTAATILLATFARRSTGSDAVPAPEPA
ncbi:MAG TPA: MFS transporter [Gaiellaceae bacterium]|nr:MFS transporter [Gaiellaceae bacterium]